MSWHILFRNDSLHCLRYGTCQYRMHGINDQSAKTLPLLGLLGLRSKCSICSRRFESRRWSHRGQALSSGFLDLGRDHPSSLGPVPRIVSTLQCRRVWSTPVSFGKRESIKIKWKIFFLSVFRSVLFIVDIVPSMFMMPSMLKSVIDRTIFERWFHSRQLVLWLWTINMCVLECWKHLIGWIDARFGGKVALADRYSYWCAPVRHWNMWLNDHLSVWMMFYTKQTCISSLARQIFRYGC